MNTTFMLAWTNGATSTNEYACDEDGDGFHKVHVNTMEGLWLLLRSGLRPHRGISQAKLPLYLGFFEFVHNTRRPSRSGSFALPARFVAFITVKHL